MEADSKTQSGEGDPQNRVDGWQKSEGVTECSHVG